MTRPFLRFGRPVFPPPTDDRGDSEFIPVYAPTLVEETANQFFARIVDLPDREFFAAVQGREDEP